MANTFLNAEPVASPAIPHDCIPEIIAEVVEQLPEATSYTVMKNLVQEAISSQTVSNALAAPKKTAGVVWHVCIGLYY